MVKGIAGNLVRKSDGYSRTQTLWRGLQRLEISTEMYAILTRQKFPHFFQSGLLPTVVSMRNDLTRGGGFIKTKLLVRDCAYVRSRRPFFGFEYTKREPMSRFGFHLCYCRVNMTVNCRVILTVGTFFTQPVIFIRLSQVWFSSLRLGF
jgi:hypothetical protein